MSDPSDLEALAKRFLDLWQEQATAAAAEPAVVDATRRLAEMTAAAPAAWFAMWTQALQAAQHGAAHGQSEPTGNAPRAPDGAAAPGAAPDGRAVDLGELLRRLAELERRVARLEQRATRPARGRARKPVAAADGGAG